MHLSCISRWETWLVKKRWWRKFLSILEPLKGSMLTDALESCRFNLHFHLSMRNGSMRCFTLALFPTNNHCIALICTWHTPCGRTWTAMIWLPSRAGRWDWVWQNLKCSGRSVEIVTYLPRRLTHSATMRRDIREVSRERLLYYFQEGVVKFRCLCVGVRFFLAVCVDAGPPLYDWLPWVSSFPVSLSSWVNPSRYICSSKQNLDFNQIVHSILSNADDLSLACNCLFCLFTVPVLHFNSAYFCSSAERTVLRSLTPP